MDGIYLFPTHLGGGNRGCEALTKSTCELLNLKPNEVFLYSKEVDSDRNLNLDQYGNIIKIRNTPPVLSVCGIYQRLIKIAKIDKYIMYRKQYSEKVFVKNATVFITGGDLYCYPGSIPLLHFIQQEALQYKCKIILWGCSIEKELLSPNVIDDLNHYDLITVRESLSYNNLLAAGVTARIYLVPDTAFYISPQECKLPSILGDGIVGINISNYVNSGWSNQSLFLYNIYRLIDYIITNTSLSVLLIPHVLWDGQDDRILSNKVYDKYKASDRVNVLDTANLSYAELRHVISKCRYFIGARTHAIISAYSTGVPALALGYSVKSQGIAKDLGLDPKLVVNCKCLRTDDDILNAFLYLKDCEQEVQTILNTNVPFFKKRLEEFAAKMKGKIN